MHNHKQNANSQSIADEASAWFARLQADDVSEAEQAQFKHWYQQNQAHAKTYDQQVKLWEMLKIPAQNVQTHLQVEQQKQSIQTAKSPRFPLSRSIPVLMVLLLLFYQAPKQYQNWRSDYVTAPGEQLSITLTDGSRVILNTDSALAVDYSQQQRAVELLRGEAYFEVESDKARPFLVAQGEIVVQAVGTAFSVKADNHTARIVVSEGIVQVFAEQTEAAILTKNQRIDYQQRQENKAVQSNISEEFAWQRGQLVFNQQALESVINEVNRYHKGRIIIINPDLKKRIVSGVFDTSSPNAVVTAITSTLHVKSLNMVDQLVGRSRYRGDKSHNAEKLKCNLISSYPHKRVTYKLIKLTMRLRCYDTIDRIKIQPLLFSTL